MNASLDAVQQPRTFSLPPPKLRRACFEDYEGIARLGLAQSMPAEQFADWQSFWIDNPLWPRVCKSWPIGWVLENSSGETVGSFLNIPSLYTFQGQDLICSNGRAWAVAAPYRGYALWLIDEYFNQTGADLFINTTVGPLAAPALDRLSNRIPVGDWEAASCWLVGYVGFARKRLRRLHLPLADILKYPAAAVLKVRDALSHRPFPRIPQGFLIESADRFDHRFDAFWDELIRQNPDKLLAERSTRALSWHFGIPMRTNRLWIFAATRKGRLCAYCTFICRSDNRQVDLADYQTIESGVDLLPILLEAALRCSAKYGVYTLVNSGRGVPKLRALDEHAPYRLKQGTWCFYYRAANKFLETKLQEPQYWDPSTYDGDASLA
jgi:hypothetical protein